MARVADQSSPQPTEADKLSNRLITFGCALLIFPCGFLSLMLIFYLGPVLVYGIQNGF